MPDKNTGYFGLLSAKFPLRSNKFFNSSATSLVPGSYTIPEKLPGTLSCSN